MSKLYTSPSPIFPDDPNDPRWPDSREERCARYDHYYSMFWMLRVINQAQRYAEQDAKRSGRKQ